MTQVNGSAARFLHFKKQQRRQEDKLLLIPQWGNFFTNDNKVETDSGDRIERENLPFVWPSAGVSACLAGWRRAQSDDVIFIVKVAKNIPKCSFLFPTPTDTTGWFQTTMFTTTPASWTYSSSWSALNPPPRFPNRTIVTEKWHFKDTPAAFKRHFKPCWNKSLTCYHETLSQQQSDISKSFYKVQIQISGVSMRWCEAHQL